MHILPDPKIKQSHVEIYTLTCDIKTVEALNQEPFSLSNFTMDDRKNKKEKEISNERESQSQRRRQRVGTLEVENELHKDLKA